MILGDDNWYTPELTEVISISDLAGRRGTLPRIAVRSKLGRGLALWWLTRHAGILVIPMAGAVTRSVLLLERIAGSRRRYLVLLEFIPVLGEENVRQWGERSALRRRARSFYARHILRPVVNRSLLCAHCLTRWEIDRNVTAFDLPAQRFRYIPWFGPTGDLSGTASSARAHTVLASGRAACDWETVFAAAAGERWPLTVVCSASDLAEVRRLNRDGRATVLSEIPVAEHDRLMADAAVYLLAMRQAQVSSGQVRLGGAATAGTAVVASDTRGLAGYLVAEENALVFAPGDHQAARAAINRLLADPQLRDRLVAGALKRTEGWDRRQYLDAVARMVRDSAEEAARAD